LLITGEFSLFFPFLSHFSFRLRVVGNVINAVFDVQPLRGCVAPGAERIFEFTYFGVANRSLRCDAVCSVDGGPDYTLTLMGAASTLKYALDTDNVEFGLVPYHMVTLTLDPASHAYVTHRWKNANFTFPTWGKSGSTCMCTLLPTVHVT
jgi:hypothetical protein